MFLIDDCDPLTGDPSAVALQRGWIAGLGVLAATCRPAHRILMGVRPFRTHQRLFQMTVFASIILRILCGIRYRVIIGAGVGLAHRAGLGWIQAREGSDFVGWLWNDSMAGKVLLGL
ncbi:MAG: hypothetical protein M1557_06670 [Actinobacteria bacterium]|nr:hypothetical protein [Actinomycetota bacterium]